MQKYAHIIRCVCGKKMAVPDSIWNVSPSYRIKLCKTCTDKLYTKFMEIRRENRRATTT